MGLGYIQALQMNDTERPVVFQRVQPNDASAPDEPVPMKCVWLPPPDEETTYAAGSAAVPPCADAYEDGVVCTPTV